MDSLVSEEMDKASIDARKVFLLSFFRERLFFSVPKQCFEELFKECLEELFKDEGREQGAVCEPLLNPIKKTGYSKPRLIEELVSELIQSPYFHHREYSFFFELLSLCQISLDKRDQAGRSAFDYALINSNKESLGLLVLYGASIPKRRYGLQLAGVLVGGLILLLASLYCCRKMQMVNLARLKPFRRLVDFLKHKAVHEGWKLAQSFLFLFHASVNMLSYLIKFLGAYQVFAVYLSVRSLVRTHYHYVKTLQDIPELLTRPRFSKIQRAQEKGLGALAQRLLDDKDGESPESSNHSNSPFKFS